MTAFSSSIAAQICTFLLTRPLRDVTLFTQIDTIFLIFLLTRPLRDVTLPDVILMENVEISTHTPLAGRDTLT